MPPVYVSAPGVWRWRGFGPKAALEWGRGWAWLRSPVSRRKRVFGGAMTFWAVVSGLTQSIPRSHLPLGVSPLLSTSLNIFLLILCVPLSNPFPTPGSLSFASVPFCSLILLAWVLVMFSPALTHVSLSSASLIHFGPRTPAAADVAPQDLAGQRLRSWHCVENSWCCPQRCCQVRPPSLCGKGWEVSRLS